MLGHYFYSFGSGPSALVFITDGAGLSIAFQNDLGTSLLIMDDGTSANFVGAFNKTYAVGGLHQQVLKTSRIAGIRDISISNLIATGAPPESGVATFTQFPGIQNLTIGGGSPIHTIRTNITGQLNVVGINCANQALNLAGVNAEVIFASGCLCNSIVFPLPNNRTLTLNISQNRLSGSLVLPALTALRTLFVGDSGGGGQQSNAYDVAGVDVSLLPALQVLHINHCFTQTLLIGANPLAAFTYLNAPACRFGQLSGVAGSLNSLLNFINRATAATYFNLRNSAYTEVDISAIIQALHAGRNARAAVQVDLYGDAYNIQYPTVTRGEAYNAPIVLLADMLKVYELKLAGHSINHNFPMMIVTALNAGTVSLFYQGVADITLWVIGDWIEVRATQYNIITRNIYQVTAGAGKTWQLAVPNTLVVNANSGIAVMASIPPFPTVGILTDGNFTGGGVSWATNGTYFVQNGEVRTGAAGEENTVYYQDKINFSAPYVIGASYRMAIYIREFTSGTLRVHSNANTPGGLNVYFTSEGLYYRTFTAAAGDDYIIIQGSQTYKGVISWIQITAL